MASRDTIKHTISLAEPVGASIGDEWFNPATPTLLYKRVVKNNVVGWSSISLDDGRYLPLTGGTITTVDSSTSLNIVDNGINGANLKLSGNGATTPNKFIRAYNGSLEVINHQYSLAIFRITDAGAIVATGDVTAFSDERLKKDWATVATDFIEQLSKIKSGTITRTDTGERQAGNSAQSWHALLPEVVMENDRGTLSLAYGNAALVSVVELAKDNVDLRKRINNLETAVQALLDKEN